MTVDEFRQSVAAGEKPTGLGGPLEALWIEAGGDWDDAHRTVQADNHEDAAWVHAYLHRKEPDESNARYWYKRCGRPFFEGTFDDEWAAIAGELLAR